MYKRQPQVSTLVGNAIEALEQAEEAVKVWETYDRSEEHTSELQSPEAISYAVFWGLRSPYSNGFYAYCIYTGGTVNDVNVYYAYFAPRPAFNLKSSIVVSDSKDLSLIHIYHPQSCTGRAHRVLSLSPEGRF